MSAFNLSQPVEGVATLTFDLSGEKVNKLTQSVLEELAENLKAIRSDQNIKALIIKSGKSGTFIAGADIKEIESLQTGQAAYELVRKGQLIIHEISKLPIPTIAVIEGTCLGGGLELALACDYRVVSDHPKTSLGLPEVNLGIIPGFGGTQRLPRLLGLQKGLELVLSGRPVDGKKAAKLALADLYVPSAFLEERTQEFVREILNNPTAFAKRRPKPSFLERSWVGRRLIFMMARKSLLKQTKGQYPAPEKALYVIKKTHSGAIESGLDKEARVFSELVGSEVSRNLIQLFFTQEALKKQNKGEVPKTLAVLGAGLMGGGIAWAASHAGLSVRIKDVKWTFIAKAYETAAGIYRERVKRRRLTPNQMQMKMAHLSGTTEYAGMSKASVVIEAIPEDMTLKKSVFKDLEPQLNQDAIIASNTSALSITEMASDLKRPERFVGMHFFSPVHKMPLVEIIPGEKTSEDTLDIITSLAFSMKKTPIVVQNCPGFLVNRILLPYVNEAVYLLEEGVSVERIDGIAESFGMPIGPLALADEVGLDVGMKVSKILEKGYGDRMAPPNLFNVDLAGKGFLGKKTGRGFYLHKGKKKQVNQALIDLVSIHQKSLSDADILDRLILLMVNEAGRCIEESIVASPAFLDMAMIMGTGFPPFRGGLLRYADSRGAEEVLKRLETFESEYGKRYTPAEKIKQNKKESILWYS